MLLELYVSPVAYVTSLTAMVFIFGGIAWFGSRYLLAKRKLELQYTARTAEIRRNEMQARLDSQESIFQSLSHDIHDDVGQQLCLVKFYVDRSAAKDLADSSQIISNVLQHLRDLSHNLSAASFKRNGLVFSIIEEAEKINAQGALKITSNSCGAHTLSPDAEIVVYRIYQEAMQNILKHAGASKVTINVGCDANVFTMEIKDNGIGLSQRNASGQGIQSMNDRTEMLGGKFNIESTEAGTGITITLPLEPALTKAN